MLVLTRKPGEAAVMEYPDTERITITVLENGRIVLLTNISTN